jgi:integrase
VAIYKRGDTLLVSVPVQRRADSAERPKQATKSRRVRSGPHTAWQKGKPASWNGAPTLKEFSPRFESAIVTLCEEKLATVRFYQEKLRRLLADRQLCGARLNAIDEAAIDGYKQRRTRQASRYGRPVSPASVNRELATMRRLLRLAREWKMLDRVPRIRLLRGERNREFVLSHGLEPTYLKACPQPLRDVAILILETGVRPGEAVNLPWTDVYLQPAVRAKFGYFAIRGGKSSYAKRNLSLTAA